MTSKAKTAWIVYWEVAGDHYQVKDGDVVTLLSSRLGEERVKSDLELLYKQFSYSLEERLLYRTFASGPHKVTNPLRAHGIPVAGIQYSIGDNPMLTVRKVKNVRVKSGQLMWVEESVAHPAWLCEDRGFTDCSLKGKPPTLHDRSFTLEV